MKAKSVLLMLIALLYPVSSSAIDPLFYGSARSKGMASAHVMMSDQWSSLGNPAGLAALAGPTFSFSFENRFLIPELGLGAISIGLPTRSGTFGMGYATFGYSLYREHRAALCFGKSLGKKFRGGIGLHYLSVSQPSGYGNLYALIPVVGIQVMPLPEIIFGLQVFNPVAQDFKPEGYIDLPAVLQAGFGYKPADELLICFEAENRFQEKVSFYGGIELSLLKMIQLRFGISSGEFQGFSFGLGYRGKHTTFDMAVSRHPVLGFSPAAGITYRFK